MINYYFTLLPLFSVLFNWEIFNDLPFFGVTFLDGDSDPGACVVCSSKFISSITSVREFFFEPGDVLECYLLVDFKPPMIFILFDFYLVYL